jgi:hypothetical protein
VFGGKGRQLPSGQGVTQQNRRNNFQGVENLKDIIRETLFSITRFRMTGRTESASGDAGL